MEGVEKIEHVHGHHVDHVVEYQSLKFGMWLFIATELLLFGGLFAAYTIFRAKFPEMFAEQHLELNKTLGALNTAVLILSSLTMALGVTSIQRGKPKRLALFLLLTILLGLAFGVNKYFEYSAKFHHHIYPGTSIFFSLYFTMTGLHMLHVFAGMALLTTMLVLTLRGRFSDKYYTPVEVSGLYWHLVDLKWRLIMDTKAHADDTINHITPYRIYVLVWVTLMVLTVISVGVSYFHFGIFNIVVVLAVASVKASLVALYFMHLKYEDKITWVFALYPLGLLALLIGLSISDVFFRAVVSP